MTGVLLNRLATTGAIALLLATTAAQENDNNNGCSEPGSLISIVAAPSLAKLLGAWAEQYTDLCPDVSIEVEVGGSATSVARACGTAQGSTSADIAGMTRLPFPGEATTEDGWNYDCERSTRNLIGVSQPASEIFEGV